MSHLAFATAYRDLPMAVQVLVLTGAIVGIAVAIIVADKRLDGYLLRRFLGRRVVPQCPRCHYNLTGNVSGVCPECGTPVTPSA